MSKKDKALKMARSVISSINQGKQHALIQNQETVFWQREEWVRWALDEVLPLIDEALAEPEHEPVFWYRPRSDGGFEGPIHNDKIEDVRKNSGAWHPLYTHQAPSQQAESELVSALAACRDAFPVPAEGEPGDAELQSAIADPLAVPEYVRIMIGQQSGYTAVDMSTAAADGYRDGREAMRQETAGQAAAGGPEAWPCEIVEADFQHGEVLLAMNCTGYKVSAGTHYLSKFAPQAPAPTTQPAVLSDFLRTYNLQSAYAAHVDRWGQQTPQAPTNTPIGAASMPANYGRFVAQHQAPAPAQWQEPTDEEIAGIMGWKGPGAYTQSQMRRIKNLLAALRAKNGGAA